MTYQKRVLITGGAGFIGSNLLDVFVPQYPNYFFLCVDKLNYASVDIRDITAPSYKFVKLDLTDYSLLAKVLDEYAITDIINLAAESCVDRSFENPVYFSSNNILSTQNLLEYVRTNRLIRFIHISTDEVYGEQSSDAKVDESGPLQPTNPYSATKAAVDLIIRSYEYSYDLQFSIIRSNNVYGPNQYPEKIIPMALDRLKHHQKITLHGDGHHKRSYLYIKDFIAAVDLVWHQNLYGIYNVGSPCEISNLELVKTILRLLDIPNPKEHIEFVDDRNYNDSRYLIDYSKIQAAGWNPQIDLETGLKQVISRYL